MTDTRILIPALIGIWGVLLVLGDKLLTRRRAAKARRRELLAELLAYGIPVERVTLIGRPREMEDEIERARRN